MEPIQMLITFYPDKGGVSVTGPIENKVVAYGMLQMARDAIRDFKPPTITPATALDLNGHNRKN